MKKRKKQAHLDISISKEQKKNKKWNQKQVWFTHSAICIREIFGPRLKHKRRMYLYQERKEKQNAKAQI